MTLLHSYEAHPWFLLYIPRGRYATDPARAHALQLGGKKSVTHQGLGQSTPGILEAGTENYGDQNKDGYIFPLLEEEPSISTGALSFLSPHITRGQRIGTHLSSFRSVREGDHARDDQRGLLSGHRAT